MALPTPNTDPRKGRPMTEESGKGGAETNETTAAVKGLEDIENEVSERLKNISGFLEVMKNYIPKLGFIDAHTQATKLSTDQIKKDLKEVVKQLTESPVEEGDAQEVNEEGNEINQTIADRIRNIDKNVEKMASKIDEPSEESEDARNLPETTTVPPHTHDDDGGDDGGEGDAKKKQSVIGKSLQAFMKVFKMIGKFAAVALLVILPLLSGNVKLFEAIKETVMNLFELFKSLFDVVMQAIVPLATALLTIILRIQNTLFSALMPVLDALIPAIIEIVSVVIDVVMGIFDAIMPTIQTILDILVPIIQLVIAQFMFLFENILGPMFSLLVPIIEVVGGIINFFFDMFIGIFNGALEFIARIADFFGMGDKVRSFKIEKDESAEEAENIDFSQDDEAVEAQIKAKEDSGEINKKTADKLRKDKEKFREKQEKERQKLVESVGATRVADVPEALQEDGNKINLIRMDLSEYGFKGDVLVDPKPREDGTYNVYDTEGNPVNYQAIESFMGKRQITPIIKAAVEGLEAQELGEDGDALPGNIAAAFGMTGEELSDESLDTQDAVGAAAVGAGAGGGSSSINVVGGASSTTNVKNEQSVTSTSGSPTSGRGRRFRR